MKAVLLLCLLAALTLTSCADGPSVTEFRPDGTKVHYRTGGTVMARRKNVVAEIEAPTGYHIRYSTEEEDSTEVPKTYIGALMAKWLAGIQAGVTNAKTAADRDIALGAQELEGKKLTLEAAGKATSEGFAAGAEPIVGPVKPPGS